MIRGLSTEASTSCQCPTCVTSRGIDSIKTAISQIDDATNAWLEHSEGEGMSLAYLYDEIKRIAQLPQAILVRKQLREMIRTSKA